jgi:DNA-binding transcriptional ArsR family regulator
MQAKREFRSRSETEVAVLDALVDRPDEGMTVLELRTRVDVSIDTLEEALSSLKEEALIDADRSDEQLVITPANRVVPNEEDENQDQSVYDNIRDRFPF